jgi:pyruvate dehydrogenase E2 component (dihydrolipoyllysine-residue acetyltransferase)
MAHNIVMPALEMAQETGKLLAWRKKEGESVTQGEPLLDIETDKAVVEIEWPASGILSGVEAREGDVIPVGKTIGWILQPGENISVETLSSDTPISPKARRLAREHGIDLARVRGSGTEGEILAEDVLAEVSLSGSAVNASPPAVQEVMSSIACLMAKRTAQSWNNIPHFLLFEKLTPAGWLPRARSCWALKMLPRRTFRTPTFWFRLWREYSRSIRA